MLSFKTFHFNLEYMDYNYHVIIAETALFSRVKRIFNKIFFTFIVPQFFKLLLYLHKDLSFYIQGQIFQVF